MTQSPVNPAIQFEPDGYSMSGAKLMGRQVAGNAFLRAAVAGRGPGPVVAYTPSKRSAEVFGQMVKGMDASATVNWIPADRLDLVSRVGTLYLPGPGLDGASRLRLRAGPAAYSLCGVTHTTASHLAMDSIVGMLSAPVMPWDALICTSQSVLSTVKTLMDAELDYLRWRFGAARAPRLPQLPVIPLGVHAADMVCTPQARVDARAALGLADDEVAALFVGRLSFHAKAHPHAMYAGLQAAAQRAGKKLVLIQSGWFANDMIENAFVGGASQFCPDVRALFTDGKDEAARRQSWAAADLFISLSDNLQETFGLTPIEAMAAGLPVVVTDWDGYKDTVRDGVDGFRIPTWMPAAGQGAAMALAYEAGTENYDRYCGLTCAQVSVDMAVLVDRLSELVSDAALRQRMGAAARQQALAVYDWAVVYRQYQQLWQELAEIREGQASRQDRQALLAGAPGVAAGRLDPFLSFEHYATHLIGPTTVVARAADASAERYRALVGHALFSYAHTPASAALGLKVLEAVGAQPVSIQALAERLGAGAGAVTASVSTLAKMGLAVLRQE